MEVKLKELEKVRYEISILLHHDAISGTSSPTPEKDYYNIIFTQFKALNLISYELIDKLGRL